MGAAEDNRARWALIAGARGADRMPALRELIDRARASGLAAGGFLQRPTEAGGHALGRVGRDEWVPLSRKGATAAAHEEAFCSYLFDERAFARARAWLDEDAPASDVVVIDELGKLEAAGKGHHDAVRRALASLGPRKLVVLSARADQLFAIVERLGLEDDAVATLETPAGGDSIDRFVAAVLAALRR